MNWAPSLFIVRVQKRPAAEQRISAAEQSIHMSAVALTNNRVSAADDTECSHQKVFSDMLRCSCNLLRQLIVISVFRDFHVSPCAHETSNRTKLMLQHHQTYSTTVCHQGQRKEDTKAAAAFDAAHCKCRSLQLPLAADAAHVVYASPTL